MAVTIHDMKNAAIAPDLVERWRHVPPAVVADISDGTCMIDPAIRPLRPAGLQPRLFGRAVTARCSPPDFGAVLHALDTMVPGDVLVIDAGGNPGHAMIGGILGGFLHHKNVAGVICDGAIRDVAELAALQDFAVFCRSITPRGPTAYDMGEVNGAVRIGGRIIEPGDLVIGDDDGLVCLSPQLADQLIAKAEAKLAMETKWIGELSGGMTARGVFGL